MENRDDVLWVCDGLKFVGVECFNKIDCFKMWIDFCKWCLK